MVLCAKVCLYPFSLFGPTSIDILARFITTNKTDGLDPGLINDEVYSFMSTVDDVQNSVRQTSFFCKLGKNHGSTGAISCQDFDNHIDGNQGTTYSLSEGFRIMQLPVIVARGIHHNGILHKR
jgi:hypothetical protein